MSANAVEVRNVSKRFGEVHALNEVSLTIKQGDFFGLLGPNGAGKTTLMRVLCGLLAPDQGDVRILDSSLERWQIPFAVGVVPQDIALYDMLSARKNLELFGKLRGLTGKKLETRIDFVLDLIGLSDRAKSRVKGFSGGMKRRLNLGVALLAEPRVLLLDEPTVGVDPQSRASIFELLESLHGQGVTILYTTHYMEEAERLCRTIAILDHGKILGVGSLEELITMVKTPRFVRLILRSDSEKFPALAGVASKQSGLRVDYVPTSQDGLAEILTQLADFHGAQRVEVVSPNLEMLFLELTGRELRDA
ncbi:MAG: ABC transporter ATP-binding protein [Calditrichaeota bacterium]|nr:ABC transporter ATP-binding protein [Calditrichota bacterium]MCB9365604.1 ABC transporter ATP-binding protein [Calditrichota bacterium]